MNDVDELKSFVLVHARAQRIPRGTYRTVLERITHDGDGPGSWVQEWSRAGAAAQGAGRPLDACRLFTMARFPFVDGEPRRVALERAGAAFERWRREERVPLQRLDVEAPDGTVSGWCTGGPGATDAPLVLLCGGIVSTKEQWAPTLLRLRRLGVTGVVTEMPGTGDNTTRYTAESWRSLALLLQAARERTGARRAYAMTMSFSGHMGLRWAAEDPGVGAVITVGAPVAASFADPVWHAVLPRVTVDTLAHLTGTKPETVGEHVSGWGLSAELLSTLDVPVTYVASRRDEIISPSDVELLRATVRRLDLVEYDDVHASPNHVAETGARLTLALLRAHRASPARRALLRAAIPLLRTRGGARRAGREAR